jgi:arylsulfatase A-like enzyme
MVSAPEPSEHAASGPPSAASVVVAQLVVGVVASVVLGLLDVVVAADSGVGQRVSPGEFALAGAHTIALYAPIGLALGAVIGLIALPVREARWLIGLRARVGRIDGWIARDPVGFGSGLAMLVALGAALLLVRGGYGAVVRTVHREELAAWAMGGLGAAAVPVALLVFAVSSAVLSRASILLGRAATLATLAIVIVIGVGVGVGFYLEANPAVRSAYGLPALLWTPIAVFVYLGVALALRGQWRRPVRQLSIITLITVAAVLGSLLVSANVYGHRNRVRSVVEQRTVLGRRLLRGYAALTDRDGDRHTWAFGGGDCDDGDASIYPGAADPVGDGIDSDCFAGDGAPEVEAHTDGQFGPRPSGLIERPNVLVITIDALRRDHLAINGYERDTSPELDTFLSSAVQFVDVVPQSSRSLRSIPSMWTGLYASEIAFGPEYLWPALLPENHTGAELLRGQGYASSVVIATDYFERVHGFFQGFDDVLQAETPDPPRRWAVDEALPRMRRLASGDAPWLMWVHLFNVHAPYLQDGVASRYGGEEVDRYDTEIGYAGLEVQRLLDTLVEMGIEERTVVVLASDHGEGFGEHGSFNHSTTLYEEELMPLLAFRVPGVAPRRVEGLVGLLDMAPTLANLVNAPMETTISGRSLVPYFSGEAAPGPERVVFSELLPDGIAPYDIKAARRGTEKLLWWVRDGTIQYFDLEADPGEANDLSDERRDDAEALFGTLRAWVARSSRPTNLNEAFVRQNVRRTPWRFERSYEVDYGSFSLLGFDLPNQTYRPGESIPLIFYYQVDGTLDQDLFFVANLTGPPGMTLPAHFHAWHFPLHARYHTDRWRAGEFIRDPTPIVIPEEIAAPVDITLTLTVQDGGRPVDGERGGVRSGTFELATIHIEPRTAE